VNARGIAAVLALGLSLTAPVVWAEEWHEAYRSGVQALSRGEYRAAAESLRRAIALRPEPGRNVVTYGTNIEARYYPYLRLAEAYIGLEQLDLARSALADSAARRIEPSDERRQIEARLESALAAHRPPPTTAPAASPPPPATTLAASPLAEPTATPSTAPQASTSAQDTRKPTPPAPPNRPAPERPARRVEGPGETSPLAGPARGTVEIVSDPPGARAYIDDEPLGSTDPATGRLLKTSVPPGRRHVRVESAGYEELAQEIDVPAGATATFYATLRRKTERSSSLRPPLLAFAAVVLALVGVVAWMLVRRPEGRAPIWTATPRPANGLGQSPGPTPPGEISPGVRHDHLGQTWFGDYRLFEILGRGGMASVFKAEKSGELSALKRPLGSLLGDADFIERFLREAEIGRTLNHPNIVRILGRGDVDGVPYFTMELLAGQTLQAFVRAWGPPEPRAAATIVVQIAEGLDFAHAKGVVHRDLKPSNIMLLPDGTAKVMDFGIARARRFEGITTTGAFLGTPDYVAPEVIEGRGAEPRSDLYSLGALFYELLTGQRPFTGETAFVVLKKHCSEEPRAASSLRAGIPAELDGLVKRLLSKVPEARPASAEDLVVGLRDWLNRAV
jgi:eukaryotic-like serine/threonine-protein kinase